MTTKFTPGPIKHFDRISTVYDCGCACDSKGDINRVSLCAMHASAPDLYAALEAMVSCEYGSDAALRATRMARAALKRARGEA